MRTNATVTTTVVVNLDQPERFNHGVHTYGGFATYVIEQVGYSGGHTSFVGRRVLKDGTLSKRTTLLNNIAAPDVPGEIAATIRGVVRAKIGEQARALGLLR